MEKIFTPYRICPLGAHVDHQLGLVTGFALDYGMTLTYEPEPSGRIYLISKNFTGRARTTVHKITNKTGEWGDYLRAAVAALLHADYELDVGFKGVIEGTLPIGGLSSSAAIIISYLRALCKLNKIKLTPEQLVALSHYAEATYIGLNNGILDQSCEVYSKKNGLLYLDTKTETYKIIPQSKRMPHYEFAIVFSGVEHALINSAYNSRVDECKAAAYALKAYSGMHYNKVADSVLGDIDHEIYEKYKKKLPKNWQKRAEHFYSEVERVSQGVEAWRKGDLRTFGKLVFASGDSSINNYESGSPELKKLHEIALHTDGIYGGRFSGAGFKGCYMAIIDPRHAQKIKEVFQQEYLAAFPDMAPRFSVHICHPADGVHLPK
jgi:galactokinase